MATPFQITAARVEANLNGSFQESKGRFAQIAARYREADDDQGNQGDTPQAALAPAPQAAPQAAPPNARDTEWYRVNSYIADILKDLAMTYSKIARLQQDFTGKENDDLSKIAEKVLSLGGEMGEFMKAFHEGESSMVQEQVFGGTPNNAVPADAPPPEIPAEFQKPDEDFEAELDLEGDDEELKDFDEDEEVDEDKE
jgi:hypothetical protein